MMRLFIFLTALAPVSLPAMADDAKNPTVNEGVILHFDKTLPLEKNYSSKDKLVITQVHNQNRICNIWVQTPANSPAEIPQGANFLVHWSGRYLNLLSLATHEQQAQLSCIINGMLNFEMRADRPNSLFTEQDAIDILGAHIVPESIKKPFEVGGQN
jgi:hypothetical protein